MLDDQGDVFKVEKGIMKVSKGTIVTMKGVKKNGLYCLIGNTIIGTTTSVTEKDMIRTILWHKRLGHENERGLTKLENKDYCVVIRLTGYSFVKHVFLVVLVELN